jgi:hypothetical protein
MAFVSNSAENFFTVWSLILKFDLWLRSEVGERRKWNAGGEGRLANRSRSATPAAWPQTEAGRSCGTLQMPLVTSEAKSALVTAVCFCVLDDNADFLGPLSNDYEWPDFRFRF